MLIEESTSALIPITLQKLIFSLKDDTSSAVNDLNKHDLIVCILCVLMKECDLQPIDLSQMSNSKKNSDENNEIVIQHLPSIWKNKDTHNYSISFVLGHFIKYRFQFIAIPAKDSLIVNVIICGLSNQCYSMCILCDDYISLKDKSWDCIASIFMNLRDLSIKYKNSIAHRARSAVLNEEGVLNPSLLGIPYDIQLKIFGYLRLKDLGQVFQSCKYFNYLSKDHNLWKDLARTMPSRDLTEIVDFPDTLKYLIERRFVN